MSSIRPIKNKLFTYESFKNEAFVSVSGVLGQALHVILALLLMVSTAGITISRHYCGEELISASINMEAKLCCDAKDGCCENETCHFEVKDDYMVAAKTDNHQIAVLNILFPICSFTSTQRLAPENKTSTALHYKFPPPERRTCLSLLQTYLC